MDIIQNVIVEMRPRLCSCNVVIIANQSFSEKYNFKVSIRPNYIIINYSDNQSSKRKKPATKKQRILRKDSSSSYESYSDSEEESYWYSKFINVATHCKLVPSSLSSLKVEENYMSFRILTEPIGPNSSGTFYNEVYDNSSNVPVVNVVKNFCLVEKPSVFLKKSTKVKLQCSNCSNNIFITKNANCAPHASFDRILELPSDNLDMSDWFCHNHGTSGSHDHDQNKNDGHSNQSNTSFVPSETDIFYGLCYFLVNVINIKQSLVEFNKNREIVHCERCFSCLGSKLHSFASYKFWDSCVRFVELTDEGEDNAQEKFHFFHEIVQTEPKNIALDNFLNIIKYAIKNSIIESLSTSCKIVLQCKMSNEIKKSLFVWIMDKKLDILKTKISSIEQDENEIKLDHILTSKLLYKNDSDSNMLEVWLNDSAVQLFEISKDMFIEGNKHFSEMSHYIPCSFRKTNDFSVSYLIV